MVNIEKYNLVREVSIKKGKEKNLGFRVVCASDSLETIAKSDSLTQLAKDFKNKVEPPYNKEMFINGAGEIITSRRIKGTENYWQWKLEKKELSDFYKILGIN